VRVGGGELLESSAWLCVRFSHHAKNKMRQYKLTRDDVLGIVVEGHRSGEDENGNLFHIKQVRGTFYLAVVALDDGSVITIYDLRK
jgi:hypothetical protein